MKWLIGILVVVLIFLVFFMNNGDENMVEFKIETLQEGSGEQTVKSGDTITVHYTGTLEDGTKFDSSVDRGEPFTFTIGTGQVIQGWEQGFSGMKVGEKSYFGC